MKITKKNGEISIDDGSSNNLYTSCTSNINISGGFNMFSTNYYILGEYVEVKSQFHDTNLAIIVSSINVLGRAFYDSLKENYVYLPSEIEEYLQNKFKILERDEKINKIIENEE